jgi:hypothetical protein
MDDTFVGTLERISPQNSLIVFPQFIKRLCPRTLPPHKTGKYLRTAIETVLIVPKFLWIMWVYSLKKFPSFPGLVNVGEDSFILGLQILSARPRRVGFSPLGF